MWRQLDGDTLFKAKIVHLILNKETEEALELLSKHYKVSTPKLKMGMPKRNAKYPACYVAKTATIHFANSENLYNPFIILHEFYHHLRTKGMTHKGTEKNADQFAKEYITKYHHATATLL
jgi:hypothetical protein